MQVKIGRAAGQAFFMFRWRRKIDELQLWEMLRRRGTRRLANRDALALAAAVERCTACKHVRR